MNGHNSSNTYATAILQPYQENMTMNARIGFSQSFYTRGFWYGANSQPGVATSTGEPHNTTSIPADTLPILLGVQNVGVYLSISTGGGMDTFRKNLIASIPMDAQPYAINSYTTNSVEVPSLSTPNEMYDVTVELLDDSGAPYLIPNNMNTQIGLVLYY